MTLPSLTMRVPSFSEEQEQLRHYVRRFLDERSPESIVRTSMASSSGYDVQIWKDMSTQLGLQALIIPEAYGGQGFGAVELTIVLEEMGRALFCGPYLASIVLASNLLMNCDDEEARKRYLPFISTGEIIVTAALLDDDVQLRKASISTEARITAGRWHLYGKKLYVLDGLVADLILVAAKTDAGLSLFAVNGTARGLLRTPMAVMDSTRKLAQLEFHAVEAELIGVEGSAWPVLQKVHDLVAIGLSAEQAGGAQKCLEMSVQYAGTRKQFGRVIGTFQALKHKCADMLIQVEAAKSAAYYGGWSAASCSSELPMAAAIAKAYCSDAYFNVAAENVQVHGGIGFTWEHSAQLYFKRAKSSELLFGDPFYHRARMASLLELSSVNTAA